MRIRSGGGGGMRKTSGNGGGMRKKSGYGGENLRRLRLDVESAMKKFSNVEELVEHLRSQPIYNRYKRRPFAKSVEGIFEVLIRRSNVMDGSDGGSGTPVANKRRKTNEVPRRSSSSSSEASASSSDRDASSSDEEASTAVDAIYEEKFEPEIDLTRSLMREKLCKKSQESRSRGKVEKVMEVEMPDNKLHLMNEVDKLYEGGQCKTSNSSKGGGGGGKLISKRMFSDFGGIDGAIEELRRKVLLPFCHPELPRKLGVKPVTGILLHGPPGCGKTTLAEAIANETGAEFLKISAAALVSGVSGASEENIRDLFSEAEKKAPSIVFIDEIDAVAAKRENSRGMELRIVTQLITCMDESRKLAKPVDGNSGSGSSNSKSSYVLVIGATNRPDSLDPALRRPGRFDREIALGVPDEYARAQILSKLTCNLKVEGALDISKIARSTPGFVGADLEALCNEAGYLAMNRIIDDRKLVLLKEHESASCEERWRSPLSNEELEHACMTVADFEEAIKIIQPSSKREGFSDVPNVKWDDVGGLHLLRKEFDRHVIKPIRFPEVYKSLGFNLETGFLLYGPPGCGKTLIAKAVASEAGANFMHIKGPELLSKYVGESELAVRTIFSRARTCAPCVLFFDEVDSLTTRRGKEGGWVVERLLNQLLIELDGAGRRNGVYVIGATNRPDVMDPALLRSGRLGKLLYVPLPSPDERGMILKALARNKLLDSDVDLVAIGKDGACENFSGADLSALMNEAVLAAVEEIPPTGSSNEPLAIKDAHFKRALEKISPSVTKEQIEYYKLLSSRFKASRG
ncbi:Cell division control protein 48 homolog C [Striga hermonthica]|uniref:Cell division control protein 48 homolog C n=1 Tax=Striga hermonthica TaxID=68872 RepID=A0A9N7MSX7_STRHE|nr:Cell division control protein 48 homolog C [Striga hermonthica]